MSQAWWKEAVVYQIYPRSFKDSNGDGIGDLQGIISKLDYLKDLGITVLWLNPIYQSPLDDQGYDIADYQAIHPDYGSMQDWEELLEAVHSRGMKLIMDLVINHTSDEHRWFREARKSRDNPFRDYYIWRDGAPNTPPNNWRSFFRGPAWTFDTDTDQYYLHLFSRRQPDLNWENPKVEHEIFEMIRWWLDKGIDGFRMDVINLLKKPTGLPSSDKPTDPHTGLVLDVSLYANNDGMHEILNRLNQQVLSKYDLFTVGEGLAVPPDEAIKYVGAERHELQMLIHFEIPMIARNWTLEDLRAIQQRWYSVIEAGGWNANYLSNHDQPRQVSIFGCDKEFREVSAKMLALFLHTQPGTPFIHQGEEIGMANGQYGSIEDFRDISARREYEERLNAGEESSDILADLQRHSRDNGRLPVQWDSTPNAGFTTGTPWIPVNPNYKNVNVEASLADPQSVHAFYKQLIALRSHVPALVYGDYQTIDRNHDQIFAYTRSVESETLVVLLNFTGEKAELSLPEALSGPSMELLLGNYQDIPEKVEDTIELRPYEARLYQVG